MSLLKITAEITALLHIMRQVAELPQNLRGFERSVHELGDMFRAGQQRGGPGGGALGDIVQRLRDAWHGIIPAEEVGRPGSPLRSPAPQPGRPGRPQTATDLEEESRGGRQVVSQTVEQAQVAGAGRGPSRGGTGGDGGASPPAGGGRTVVPPGGGRTVVPPGGGGMLPPGGGGGGAPPVIPPGGGGGGGVPPGIVTPQVVGPPPGGGGAAGAAGGLAGMAGMMGGPVGALVTGLLVAGPSVVSFGKAIIESIQALREFAKAFNEHARNMAKYSGQAAQATARQDVERYRMDFERSRAAGPWAAAAINSRTDLEKVRQPIQQLGDKLGAAITVSTNQIESTLTEMLNQLLLIRQINSILNWLMQKVGVSTAMAPQMFDAVVREYGKNTPQMGNTGGPADPAGGMRGVSPRPPGIGPKDPGVKQAVPGPQGETIQFGQPPQAEAPRPPVPPQEFETGAESEPPPKLGGGAFGLGFNLGARAAEALFGGGKK